jgi:transcription elongation factor GreA
MTQISGEARGRLERELAELLSVERPRLLSLAATAGGDVADQADRVNIEVELGQVDMRIERLRRRLEVAQRPGGEAADLSLFVLDFGSGPERAIVGSGSWESDESVLRISADSPVGTAISGAREGETVTYRAPNGKQLQVTIVSIGREALQSA